MKILVAIFAFIALSVSAFAVVADPMNLTVEVKHQPFTCAITGNGDFGTPVYGDGHVESHTFAIAFLYTPTTRTDMTDYKYAWALDLTGVVVADNGWSGASDVTTSTYEVSFTTPTYRIDGEQLDAVLRCDVDYVR